MDTMFSSMLQLPLFQGICQEDFTNILGKVKLHFTKHKSGETFIQKGDMCNDLIFLLKGKLSVSTSAKDGSYVFVEYIQSAYLIEPHTLFSFDTHYTSSYTAESEINLLRISKEHVVKDLFKYEIFRINFTNYICNRVQTLNSRIWHNTSGSVEYKIARFILMRSERPEGEKVIRIKMDDLAHHLDDTRLNISRALNELQDRNLLQLRRKEIFVPDANALSLWADGSSR